MKLLTFHPSEESHRNPRLGAMLSDGGTVVDLQAAFQLETGAATVELQSMQAWLDAGERGRELAEQAVAFAESQRPPGVAAAYNEITVLAPLPRPQSIRDCMAFEQHLVQAARTVLKWRNRPLAALDAALQRWMNRGLVRPPAIWYERPIYYKGNPQSVIGHGADVIWPMFTQRLDFELEWGIVIGRRGRDISADRAAAFIAGYTLFNDFSARDLQLREMQGRLGPAKSKDFDTGNSIGPVLVTPDELRDPYALTMQARVNGECWSRGSTGEMHYRFEDIVAAVSESETIIPGDFIGSGTVPGGCGLELDRWLSPGDVVELEIEEIGVLRNRVVRADSRQSVSKFI